ncbi:HlyD family efflux transporter periplasmic adaptor subunit [Microbacterium sp. ZW T5_45]|uniref:HlyD family efflux transporter periplasmic adaptor subunit n=1 Tax=Microbacterium sp. ZW T5_45 TaxID=3378080 RepID=UPI00385367DB
MSDDDLFDDLKHHDVNQGEPDPEARAPLSRRLGVGARAVFGSRRNRVIAGAAATAVVLASVSGAVYAATQSDSGNYRTAEAEVADVSETLALSGQLASSSSVDAAFQVAGTVSEVQVVLGDTVEAGQQLATLDGTDLDDAVTSAEDAVASAEQTLEDALDAQASGTASISSTSDTSGTSSAPSSGSTGSAGTSSTSGSSETPSTSQNGSGGSGADGSATADAARAVSEAQQTLLAQYDATTAAGDASTTAFVQAQEICAPFLSATLTVSDSDGEGSAPDATDTSPEEGSVDGTTPADGSTGDTNAEGTGTDDTSSDGTDQAAALQAALESAQGRLSECQAAVSATQDAQTATASANTALTDAATALNEKVAALQVLLTADSGAGSAASTSQTSGSASSSAADSAASSTAPDTTASSGSGTTTSSPSGASSTIGAEASGVAGAPGTVTAEQILADQAAIDLAEAQLAIAQQNVTFASLTTPISGTVVQVSLAAGDSVSAASDSAVITVQSDGGYVVETTVSLSKIAKVATGQTAEVSLPAFDSTYTGEVSSIGVLNVSETSTPSYTVTVAVDADDSPRIGATANLEVDLSDASGVLTVPTSAITRSGSSATVTVLQDGTAQQVSVSLGAVGSERTEILDGLEEGDVVVLADLDQVITSDDETSTGLTGLGGSTDSSFPGGDFSGGFPSGGFPSGGDAPTFPAG